MVLCIYLPQKFKLKIIVLQNTASTSASATVYEPDCYESDIASSVSIKSSSVSSTPSKSVNEFQSRRILETIPENEDEEVIKFILSNLVE